MFPRSLSHPSENSSAKSHLRCFRCGQSAGYGCEGPIRLTKMTAEAQNSTSDLLTKAFIDMAEFETIQATLRDSNEDGLMDDEEEVENNAEMSDATKQLCGNPARRRKKKKEQNSNMMLGMMEEADGLPEQQRRAVLSFV